MAAMTSSSTHTAVLNSGQAGLGEPGRQALEAKGQDSTLEDAVVGPAKGDNPELITKLTSEPKKEDSSKPWYKKLAVGKPRSGSAASYRNDAEGQDDEDDVVEKDGDQEVKSTKDGIAPPTTSLPTSSSSSPPPKDSEELEGSDALESSADGRASLGKVEEVLNDTTAPMVPATINSPPERRSTIATESSLTGSVKDRVLEDHSASPNISNDKFHSFFSAIPQEEELIEDYRCALQKDVLVQGRLFLSENHLAFRANLLGWQTSLCIPFSEIVTIEKRMTALVVPNAIEITTLHTRHVFSSFLARDAAYRLISDIWRFNHPGEERNRENKSDTLSITPTTNDAEVESEISFEDEQGQRKKHRFTSAFVKVGSKLKSIGNGNDDDADDKTPAEKVKAKAKKDMAASEEGGKPGHEPTEYDGEEYANVALECVLPTSPEKAYNLFIHDSDFLKGFFEDNQGLKEVDIGDWESAGGDGLEKRHTTYLKLLSGSIGPKQTHCNISDENEKVDAETYIANVTTTQTPDVPSGNDFSVKTKSVFTWAQEGGAHVKVTTEVEWTKTNRMLKGIIERSCLDGQKKYHADLEKAAREHIEAHPDDFTDPGVTNVGGGKKGGESESDSAQATSSSDGGSPLAFLDSIGGMTAILIGLVVILALTNLFTLNALRVQARVAHRARLGQPDEVASAVSRVLDQFKAIHQEKTVPGAREAVANELHGVVRLAEELEKTVGGLVDRLKGVQSMA